MFGPQEAWDRVMAVNLWGVIHGSRIFAPGMIAQGEPGLIINTGSKQGITTPPGDPAYNVAKAGVKAFTEANPEAAARMIRCGIGDVTEPLPSAVREAMHAAIDEMGRRAQ